MKKIYYALIVLTEVFLFAALVINYAIYHDYINASGKTKALFGLTLALNYGYRLYLGIITSCLALAFIIKILKNYKAKLNYYFLLVNIIATLLYFTNVWRIFVK